MRVKEFFSNFHRAVKLKLPPSPSTMGPWTLFHFAQWEKERRPMVSLSSSISAVQYLLAPATLPKSLVQVSSPPPLSSTSSEVSCTAAAAVAAGGDEPFCLSVLSYNVLLPNSVDGWWNYKMYLPPLTDRSMSEWPYRRNLLQQRIQQIDADVVCLQEVAPQSFEDDFDFMKDLGYDQHEMFKKGRFRPATFWKSNRLALVAPPVHKDRTLLTIFEPVITVVVKPNGNRDNDYTRKNEDTSNKKQQEKKGKGKVQQQQQQKRYWYVLNCHLQAGGQAQRRLRQIMEGIKAVMTAAKKFKEKNPEESVRLIVCGDMNGDEHCGAVRYLEDGVVDETFCENGEPVTTSKKVMPLKQPLVDVAVVGRRNNSIGDETTATNVEVAPPPPPTLVVPELVSLMVKEGTADTANPQLSDSVIERLGRIYKRFATTTGRSSSSSRGDDDDDDDDNKSLVMNRQNVENWLVEINEKVGRGSEFRQAAREMGWQSPNPEATLEQEKDLITSLPDDGMLTLEGFINVYQEELKQGKFWSIAHDLAILGEALPTAGNGAGGSSGVYTARFDRMYCNAAACVPIAVLDTICTTSCPNEKEPSDHLPIAATFMGT